MANTIHLRALALIPVAAVALSCSSNPPAPDPYDPSLVAVARCVGEEVPDDLEDLTDRDIVVVPDSYCPIGDGEVPGHPYWWVYSDALPVGTEFDVPGEGDTIVLVTSGSGWTRVRPARVSTVNLARGVFREPGRYSVTPKGQVTRITPVAPTRAAAPTGSPVTRGGLGVPGARATNAPTPVPNRASAAPGPTRAPAPSRANTAPRLGAPAASAPRANVPPRPAGSRPMGTSSGSSRSGRR